MSIASEIDRLMNAKAALIAVIRSKGVEVPDTASIEQLKAYVELIQQGGYDDSTLEADFIDDDGNAFSSRMASGVASYDKDGNIIEGAAVVFDSDSESHDDYTAVNVGNVPEDTELEVESTFNGIDNGYGGVIPMIVDQGATIVTRVPYDMVAEGIGLLPEQIAEGEVVLGVEGTASTMEPETPYISVSNSGLIYATANGVESTKQLTTQASRTITPTKSSQTAVAAYRYTTGAVTVAAIPSQYIVPSGSQTLTENKEYDVTSLASVTVNVPTSGSEMNVQACLKAVAVLTTSYYATEVKLTVAKTGIYNVSWMGGRNTNSGTSGSQLYIDGSAYGSPQTSFSNTYIQHVNLTDVSLKEGQTIVVRARARSTSYVMWVGNLIIEQTA